MESHACSTYWSVANQFGEGEYIYSGLSHDQGLQCHPPNPAFSQMHSRAVSKNEEIHSFPTAVWPLTPSRWAKSLSLFSLNALFDLFFLFTDGFGSCLNDPQETSRLGIGTELGKSVVENYQQCTTQDNEGGRVNLLIPCFSEKWRRRTDKGRSGKVCPASVAWRGDSFKDVEGNADWLNPAVWRIILPYS